MSFVVLLVVAAGLALVALVPSWRRRWGWGRAGSGGPISAFGWVAIVCAVLLMAAGQAALQFRWFEESLAAGGLVVGGFVLFITAGIVDSVRRRRK